MIWCHFRFSVDPPCFRTQDNREHKTSRSCSMSLGRSFSLDVYLWPTQPQNALYQPDLKSQYPSLMTVWLAQYRQVMSGRLNPIHVPSAQDTSQHADQESKREISHNLNCELIINKLNRKVYKHYSFLQIMSENSNVPPITQGQVCHSLQ